MFAALTKQGMTAWKCDAAYFANGAGCAFETRTQIVSQTPGQTREREDERIQSDEDNRN